VYEFFQAASSPIFWLNHAIDLGFLPLFGLLVRYAPALRRMLEQHVSPITDWIVFVYTGLLFVAMLAVVAALTDAELLALWQAQEWRPSPAFSGILQSIELRLFYFVMPAFSLGVSCFCIVLGREIAALKWLRCLSVLMVPALAIADSLALWKYAMVPAPILLATWPIFVTLLIYPAMFVGLPGAMIGAGLMVMDTLVPSTLHRDRASY